MLKLLLGPLLPSGAVPRLGHHTSQPGQSCSALLTSSGQAARCPAQAHDGHGGEDEEQGEAEGQPQAVGQGSSQCAQQQLPQQLQCSQEAVVCGLQRGGQVRTCSGPCPAAPCVPGPLLTCRALCACWLQRIISVKVAVVARPPRKCCRHRLSRAAPVGTEVSRAWGPCYAPPPRLAPHLSQLCQGPAWHLGRPGRRSGRSGRPGPQDGREAPTSAGEAAAWGAEMGQVTGVWACGGEQVGGAGSGRLTSAWPAGPRPGMSQQWSRPRCPPRSRAPAPGQTSLGPARAAGTGCQRPAHLWGQREQGSRLVYAARASCSPAWPLPCLSWEMAFTGHQPSPRSARPKVCDWSSVAGSSPGFTPREGQTSTPAVG